MPTYAEDGRPGQELRRPGLLAYIRQMETLHPDIASHGHKVADHTAMVAADLGIGGDRASNLQLAAALHDIGKIAIPRRVQDKPGPLSQAEWNLMRTHPAVGARILRKAGFDGIAGWVLSHHERPDGLGYPHGLRGTEIQLEAHVIAVTDAYDAMTSDRPHRAAISHEAAIEELMAGAGSQFDTEVVEAFTSSVSALVSGGAAHVPC
jgi:putative nucleotidyltransferase with HDIG domain